MSNLEKYKKRLEFEHELINRRLTWLLTSQSILFAAIAFVLGKEKLTDEQLLFSKIISVLGMSIAFAILIGIIMGIAAKIITWQDSKKEGIKHFGVRTWITCMAFIPDVFMPIAFGVAWWYILDGVT